MPELGLFGRTHWNGDKISLLTGGRSFACADSRRERARRHGERGRARDGVLGAVGIALCEYGYAVCPKSGKIRWDFGDLKTILKLGMDSSEGAVLLEFIAFGRVLTGALGEVVSQDARHKPTTLT